MAEASRPKRRPGGARGGEVVAPAPAPAGSTGVVAAAEPVRRRWFAASLAIGLMGLAMVGILLVAVLPTRAYFSQRRQLTSSEQRLAVLQAENRRLSDQVAAMQNPAEVEKAARDQFNLTKPGEQVINLLPLPALSTTVLPDAWPYSIVRSVAALRRTGTATTGTATGG